MVSQAMLDAEVIDLDLEVVITQERITISKNPLEERHQISVSVFNTKGGDRTAVVYKRWIMGQERNHIQATYKLPKMTLETLSGIL